MIVLDTNAIVYYLQGEERAIKIIDQVRKREESFIISTITELELFSYASLSKSDVATINLWLNQVFIIPVDSIVARKAAQIRQSYKLKTPDAIIAATALLYGNTLISFDQIFEKIPPLTILN